jgi:hypothetical protein
MAVNLPREGAVAAALDPEGTRWWTADTYLLAHIADTLALANWQRADGKGSRPKPIPRPTSPADMDVETIKGDSVETIADFDAWYREMFPERFSAPESAQSNETHPTNEPRTDSVGPDTNPAADPEG